MGLFIRSWHCKDTIVYKLQYTSFSRLIRIAVRLVKRSMRGQIQLKRKGQAEMVHVRKRTCFENARIRIYHVLGPMIFRHQTRSKQDIYMWVSILAMECVRKLPRGQVLVLQSQRSNLKCVHLMWGKNGILNLFLVATQRFFPVHPDFFWGNETFPIWQLRLFFKQFFFSTTQLYTSSIFLPFFFQIHLIFFHSTGFSHSFPRFFKACLKNMPKRVFPHPHGGFPDFLPRGGGCSTHVARHNKNVPWNSKGGFFQ